MCRLLWYVRNREEQPNIGNFKAGIYQRDSQRSNKRGPWSAGRCSSPNCQVRWRGNSKLKNIKLSLCLCCPQNCELFHVAWKNSGNMCWDLTVRSVHDFIGRRKLFSSISPNNIECSDSRSSVAGCKMDVTSV